MAGNNMRTGVIIFSIVFTALLAACGAAEFLFVQGRASGDVALVRKARQIAPWVSEYFYEEYRLAGDAAVLSQAMALEPTRPAYHMYYGLALLKQVPRTRAGDQRAVAEICRAASLKPYSDQYARACRQYKSAILQP